MSFWTTTPERDPKRNFRFQVFITGIQDSEPAVWWAKKVQKPNFTVAESKHVYLGHTFYYPGKVEWQAITMTLVDPVDPGSLFRINNIVRAGGYVVPGDANTLTTQSKNKANSSLGAVQVRQLDANGNAIETWELKNPFIKKVSFSELDYENDDISTIDLELRYDWATCETFEGNGSGTFFEAE